MSQIIPLPQPVTVSVTAANVAVESVKLERQTGAWMVRMALPFVLDGMVIPDQAEARMGVKADLRVKVITRVTRADVAAYHQIAIEDVRPTLTLDAVELAVTMTALGRLSAIFSPATTEEELAGTAELGVFLLPPEKEEEPEVKAAEDEEAPDEDD